MKPIHGNEKFCYSARRITPVLGGDKQEPPNLRNFAVHDLILISDEVHNDSVFAPAKHSVLATAVPDISHRLVTLVATTKTFNLAGAMIGSMVTADDHLRQKFQLLRLAARLLTNLG